MNKLAIIFLFALPVFAGAQTDTTATPTTVTSYSIIGDKDSFFLVETVSVLPTKKAPRPQKLETAQLFYSKEQLLNYITYLRTEAENALKQSDAVLIEGETKAQKARADAAEQAKKLRDVAPQRNAMAAKIEAAYKASTPVFSGTGEPKKPPTKPKKKKKA